ALDQHLLRTRQDKEVLGVVVAVQRHRYSGWYHSAHDPEVGAGIIWAADEFDRRSKHVQRRVGGSVGNLGQNSAVELVRWHVERVPYLWRFVDSSSTRDRVAGEFAFVTDGRL